jgi:hypothetical protein
MKFQKGILNDVAPKKPAISVPRPEPAEIPPPKPEPKPVVLREVEKNRLFETQEEFEGSSKNYLKIFAVVVGLIVIASVGIFYFTLPNVGDQVRTPPGLEDAVREHFLSKEKRTATDVVAYKCDGFYWLRVGVETRKDMPNPVYKIGTYAARGTEGGSGEWQVTAQPVPSGEGTPCQ